LEKSDDVIGKMATDYFRLPSCLMARLVLKSYQSMMNASFVPEKNFNIANAASRYLYDPNSVTDENLRVNIRCCIENDDIFSPKMDVYRQ